MKKSAILLSCLLLILTACGADPKPVETIRVVEEEEIRKGMYQEVEYLERMPQVTQIAPFMPENAISGCFCANGDTVFYLAYFGDYLLDQETGNNKEFEPQYNTQIWAYDKESGSCALIYQYDEDWCVEISDMVCDESTLVWEDYGDEGWRLQAMPLDGSASPEIIISKADMNSDIWTVTPAVCGNRVYWYDSKAGEEGFSAYEYDLTSGTLTRLQEGIAGTPYEHISVMNRMFTFCETAEDIYRLQFRNMDTGDSLLLETTVPVLNPISNGRVCAWRTSYDSDKRLYVYDHKADTMEWIELPKDVLEKEGDFFSYAVLDRMVIVNYRGSSLSRVGRLLCYDIETKTYTELAAVDENGTLMYTFQDSESRVSLEMSLEQDDFQVLEIFYDSEQN